MTIKLTENQSKIADITLLCQVAIRLKRDLEPEANWTEGDETKLASLDDLLMGAIKLSQKLQRK